MRGFRPAAKVAEWWRRWQERRLRRHLPELVRLNLVAALEEGGRRSSRARANWYTVKLPPAEYAVARSLPRLAEELAAALKAEARRRGYQLAGPVRVEIVPGEGRFIQVEALERPEPASEEPAREATITFRLPRAREANARAAPPSLAVIRGPDEGTVFTLWGEKVYVGRRETNHVVLHDPGVSRVHLELTWRGDKLFLRDLGSLNGTWVNGRPVTEAELKPGDQITLGSTCLEYRR
ncbi:MAG: hypothetical protein PWQ41_997 [Bacillota bacterium]|nr:hypothetical protein [Bacillota bacterium]MDK2855079.1 hypothetical protein [Bacillota bacterium]MDK2925223.1 hypothetical protein [Bacillota bacterium]